MSLLRNAFYLPHKGLSQSSHHKQYYSLHKLTDVYKDMRSQNSASWLSTKLSLLWVNTSTVHWSPQKYNLICIWNFLFRFLITSVKLHISLFSQLLICFLVVVVVSGAIQSGSWKLHAFNVFVFVFFVLFFSVHFHTHLPSAPPTSSSSSSPPLSITVTVVLVIYYDNHTKPSFLQFW